MMRIYVLDWLRYTTITKHDCDLTNEWWNKISALPEEKLNIAKEIISRNKFDEDSIRCDDPEILEVLSYYRISRDDAEN